MPLTIRLVIGFVLLTVPTLASVINVSFPDFSSTSGLTLNGSAAVATTSDGKVLRLTPTAVSQAGSAFSSTSIAFNGSSDSFSTFFQFRITNPGGIAPADGFVFVVQPVSSSIGGAGGGIGYSGIPNSIGVEFDTYQNGWDINSNHVAIVEHGDITTDINPQTPGGVGPCTSFTASPNSNCMSNGDLWSAWIDYNGTTIEVRLADNSSERPVTALLSQSVNIPCLLGGGNDSGTCGVTPGNTAFVGFTSGTGGGFENHDIKDWQYTNTFSPIGSSIPEPSTWLLLGTGLFAFGMFVRRRNA
jgi:hypothetical protein